MFKGLNLRYILLFVGVVRDINVTTIHTVFIFLKTYLR